MLIIFHNLRNAPAVSDQPHVAPVVWRVFEKATDIRHICMITEEGSLRLTSAIVALDVAASMAVTESGRCYELLVPPTSNPELTELLLIRAELELGNRKDVSDEIWAAMVLGRRRHSS